ncbi:hypothetical protein PKNFJJPA_00018 [Salmonella phage vB_SenAc_BPS6]|uniref:Uncharacterized protein n=6 Tax=Kuttervirus TaxID=2169536 RepID=A0A1W5PUT9_9CAUD|nr:hypothetical protein BI169_gp083 [Salmonella phage GG32]APD18395.1 hypothetical protein STP07_128 [Salmonella phage STP07]QIQ62151.1 hypothetical protein kage_83 [Salmonella phage kage]QQO86973.1 hypothetical protein PKNFJJPA_00018 [Salmonella phage vB_SenAc_BPS6]QQO88924.1 hypothetical protein JHLACNCA_00193 [Salmonella phage vB_SenAc_BPS3]QQO89137.1 hypothetical protein AAMKOAHC_00133 [Salmonella phage vB_SenAc_BPS5]
MAIPSFLNFLEESKQLDEAFNSSPYELTFGKKNAGDIFFTFVDEDEKEFRIQFYTPQGLGKNVRQVFIGQKRGSTYPDAIGRFKNPMRVIASMIEATKQFMATPLGKTIDGFAINFSKKALERGVTLLPKIIRQSGLKQKLNVMDLTYTPIPDRAFVWVVRKGKDPAQVFDGPKMKGVTWDDPDKVGDVPDQKNNPDVGVSSSVDDSNGWKLTSDGNQPMMIWSGREKGRLVTANIAPHYNEPGVYVGAYMNEKSVRGQSADFIARQLKLPQVPISILNDFTTASTKFWKGSQQKSAPVDSNTTIGATSIEQLIDSGFVARVLGIIDTNIDQKASYLPGESIKKIGQARYQTKGGLVIIVSFDSVDGKNLKYSVFSEIETQPGVISGDARRVANEVMETITYVAEHQYRGEWEINAVPMSAPYPIKSIRHSQGWGYVETANWTLKIADAVLNRVKPGNTALLELNKEPLRGKHLLEIIPEKGDKTLMLKDRSGAIYGSIDLNAQGADLVNSGTLKMPSNAMVFGETVNGMSVTWTGVNFPKGGKYDGAVLTTNVTYYYDKGKVAFTPMVSNKGRTLNNPKTYELPLKKEFVQGVLDDTSDEMSMVTRNMQTLVSTNYNPKQVFLNDIYVDDSGAVLWRGHNMGDRRTTEIMLNTISKETERLEKEPGTTKKTGVDLATYAGSIRDNAPKGRDLDWQIYASRDGQTLNVDWDITFRRNTTEGAYREFKDQINRANQYLQTVYNDAKSKGYNPTVPNLMTLERARQSDEWAVSNGDSAYSEYEQSLGGNLQISLK